MIADWSADVGPERPLIHVPWDGWVNLSWDASDPALPWRKDLAVTLPEVQAYPELLPILRLANSLHHFTSKVDVFPVERAELDPEIAEAWPRGDRFSLGSYIDVVTPPVGRYRRFDEYEAIARATVKALLCGPDWPGGADIVIRPASLDGRSSFGWTLYAFGFGADEARARAAWARVCGLLIAVFGLEVASGNIGRSTAIANGSAQAVRQAAGE